MHKPVNFDTVFCLVYPIPCLAGPMYNIYNNILRSALEGSAEFANLYPTTIGLIVSGILKLCRVAKMPEGGAVFRGLSGLALPPEFFERDQQGFAGGVEPSFMSTTTSDEVAREYSGVREGREATIFCLLLGKTSLGADVSWLSQFAGEKEMLFPPRTHLQIVGEPVLGPDGVSVVKLKPTVFQNVRTMEQVEQSRKEGMKQLASSLTWDCRNEAAREGALDSELAMRLEALEAKLLADHCGQDAGWYNDNFKYKDAFQNLVREAVDAGTKVRDSTSLLSRSLADKSEREGGGHDKVEGKPGAVGSTDGDTADGGEVPVSTTDVSALHSKFDQDPNFKGIRGKFGSDSLFAAGIDAVVGPMDAQYIRGMYNEHCLSASAKADFTAWNAGNVINTTPEREWLFVVGAKGLDLRTWEFVPALAEPEVHEGMMVNGRNAKWLIELIETEQARRAGLSAAEIVAVRLYTGVPSDLAGLGCLVFTMIPCHCLVLSHT